MIGTQQRPHLFQLNIPEPELLYPHAIEVDERLDTNGQVLKTLTEKEIQRLVAAIRKAKVQGKIVNGKFIATYFE